MFSALALFVLVTLLSLSAPSPVLPSLQAPQVSNASELVARTGAARGVWYVTGCDNPAWSQVALQPGPDGIHTKYFMLHGWMLVEGNDVDGPIKTEIADDRPLLASGAPASEAFNIRVFDLTTAQSQYVIQGKAGQTAVKLGTTTATNGELADPDTGKGILADAWNEDNTYRNGQQYANDYDFDENPPTLEKQRLNTCHNYIERVATKLNIPMSGDAAKLLQYASIACGISESSNGKYSITKLYRDVAGAYKSKNTRTVWRMNTDNQDFDLIGDKNALITADGGNFNQAYDNAELTDPATGKPMGDEEEILIDEEPLASAPSSAHADGEVGPNEPADPTNAGGDEVAEERSIAVASVDGKLQLIKTVGGDFLKAVGAVGTIVAAAFVVLEFIHGDWKGGIIGLVGIGVGLAALAYTGPVGWLIGGAVALLLAILPGMFKDQHPAAAITDVQGVIQWKWFGDSTHTGNEQCRSQGDPTCQVLYGPGTIAFALGMENFDAVVFLLKFNQGYPMSIPDIAKAFTMLDAPPSGNSIQTTVIGGSLAANAVASIECNNKPGSPSRYGWEGDKPNLCNHPTFAINRKLITLPILNQTADQVYDRIIPAPNGDCKIVVFPETQAYPEINMTITGAAASIACGLNPSTNVNGTVLEASSGNSSTSGQNGASVPAPPSKPFAPITSDQAVCIGFSNTQNTLCLTNGTYTNQDGGLGFDLVWGNSLTVPNSKFSLTTKFTTVPELHGGGNRPVSNTYSSNTKSKQSQGISEDFENIHNPTTKGSFVVNSPSDPPAVCLFTEPQYGGNVACFGVGGDALPSNINKAAQSLQLNGGANAWIYAEKYDDEGGALVNGNIPDLTAAAYGTNGNFNKNITAMWVYAGP